MSKNYEMAGPERILKKKRLIPWDSEIIWIIIGECNEVLKELCNCRSLLDPASFHRLIKVAPIKDQHLSKLFYLPQLFKTGRLQKLCLWSS